MYKILVLYPQPSDPARFRDHYVSKHVPLAATLPGLIGSRYSFEVAGQGPGAPSPFFCVWEGDFADEGAAIEAMTSDIGHKIAADGANYTDVAPTIAQFTAIEG